MHSTIQTDEQFESTSEMIEQNCVSAFTALGLSELSLLALERAGYKQPSPRPEHSSSPRRWRAAIASATHPRGRVRPRRSCCRSSRRSTIASVSLRRSSSSPPASWPTRSAASSRSFATAGRLRAVAIVGGESMFKQIKILQSGCQIVVATPGRLMDLMDRQAIRLDKVRFVVLDEADQMLDIGFRPAVEAILDACPAERQTFLLSATMPREVRDLTRRYMKDPADVRLIHEDEDATIPAIRQGFLMVSPERKLELLFRLLEREQPARALIFCRTKHGADKVGNLLRNDGFKAEAMHGDLSQSQRNRVLAAFRVGRLTTLVATDVVGRGIDVPGISHVINFDIPEDPEHYVHRIGRTGRMGKDGAAFTFVLPDQGKLLDQIEKAISRNLEHDKVDGVPTMNRPASMQLRRPQGRPFNGNGGRWPRPPTGPAPQPGSGPRRRRRRSARRRHQATPVRYSSAHELTALQGRVELLTQARRGPKSSLEPMSPAPRRRLVSRAGVTEAWTF